jgi:hypothetical protein
LSYVSGTGSGLLCSGLPPVPALQVSRARPALPCAGMRVNAEVIPGKQVIVDAVSLARFLVCADPNLIPAIFRRSAPADVLWPAVVAGVTVQVTTLLPRWALASERLKYERVDPAGHLLAFLAQPDEQVALLVASGFQYPPRAIPPAQPVEPGDAPDIPQRGDLIKAGETDDAAPLPGVRYFGHVHQYTRQHASVCTCQRVASEAWQKLVARSRQPISRSSSRPMSPRSCTGSPTKQARASAIWSSMPCAGPTGKTDAAQPWRSSNAMSRTSATFKRLRPYLPMAEARGFAGGF